VLDLTHMSIDIETLGTASNALVLSIGASVFHPREGLIHSRSWKLERKSQVTFGRLIDPDTVGWWVTQNSKAQHRAFDSSIPEILPDLALEQLGELWTLTGCRMAWGFGAVFDLGIIESLADDYEVEVPWSHRQQGCLRTMSSLYPDVPRPKPEVSHDPMHDSMAQGFYLMDLLKRAYNER